MRPINLLSLIDVCQSPKEELVGKYLAGFGVRQQRPHEMNSLKLLVQELRNVFEVEDDVNLVGLFDGYYLGYCIPQINKEFDLLRFGSEYIVNIELKTLSEASKIEKQLIANRYYLQALGQAVKCFTYESDSKRLFQLDGDTLTETTIAVLANELKDMELAKLSNVDDLFSPTSYLVSPFNSPQKFLASSYFLTQHQQQIKEKVVKQWMVDPTSSFLAITGAAGTGKTLLVYDIAKELMAAGKRVLIVHCGGLNQGQKTLNEEGWNIWAIRRVWGESLQHAVFDLLIVDEVQRIYPWQFKIITDVVQQFSRKCIFSYDKNQYLSTDEQRRHNVEQIETIVPSPNILKLTDKIRTNKEVATFIKLLLNSKSPIWDGGYPNVEISFFSDYESVKRQLEYLCNNDWMVINYTPGVRTIYYYEKKYNSPCSSQTAHSVIGQEYDNVVGVIDEYFFYDEKGKLKEKSLELSKYYSQYGMLYQILTRTRKKLHLIIANNTEVLERCLEILQERNRKV